MILNSSGNLQVLNSMNSSNVDDGGAFTVLGGASFKKDVYIGGVLNINGGTIAGGTSSTEFAYLTLSSTDESINLSTGSLVTFGGITIQCTTNATSITNGGSFLTAGGASIGKNLFVGGPILQIPYGTSSDRPISSQKGYIRYNTETNQFEGYGPGNAWGSLGGVVDIAQTTKILASANPSTTDGNLYFYTAGNERMRMNSSGNIGIGMTSPGYLVDIAGSLRITNGNLLATHNSNTIGNIFTTGGNVGINTTDPNVQLHVNGKAYFGNGIPSQSNNYQQIVLSPNTLDPNITEISMEVSSTKRTYLTTNSSDGTTLGNNFGPTIINSNSLSSIFVQGGTSGTSFVGINTTTPQYNLDINGTLRINDNLVAISDTNTLGNVFTIGENVGIGTVSPGYLLDVNGNLHISSDLYVDGVINGGAQTSSTFAYLTLTATDDSINLSTGSLVTFGGITIQDSTDSSSVTNGGSLLTAGGASVGKSLYVGRNLNVTSNITTNITNINSTENASGVGTGGSLTVLGGASFNKDVYVGGTVTSSSDIRLKCNIKDFKRQNEKFLDKIDPIRTVLYNYKEDESLIQHVGFIAQDFETTFPELLRRPNSDGYYSLDYQKMSVVLLECVKELKQEIHNLRSEINDIKKPKRRVTKAKRGRDHEEE